MWLGGLTRTLDGANSRVGLHGNYDNQGRLRPGAPERLRRWLPGLRSGKSATYGTVDKSAGKQTDDVFLQ
jgi:hypothetical protein